MEWPVVVTSASPQATKEVAARLAGLCDTGDVVLLVGDVGAGKTVFAQGFAAALGVDGPVTSPTFALVRQYRCGPAAPVATLIHADVYRTGSLGEVMELALGELVEERAIALVEWGDLAAPVLGDDTLEVTLARPEDPPGGAGGAAGVGRAGGPNQARVISVTGRGRWARRADDVTRALSDAVSTVAP
jgi:tRNA threonylcarbamoyladenosine biosynthesis protein TsaE